MISRVFRRHPELAPSGRVTIVGRSRCAAERMSAYAARRNPNVPEVAGLYLDKGARYGIRGDVAFCQAMHDTQVWTLTPQFRPWRATAPSVWDSGDPEWTDSELDRRTELHLQQLAAFVSSRGGDTACWEDLNGKWAVPGGRYGQDILAIWRNMMEWKGEGEWVKEIEGNSVTQGDTANPDEQNMEWLSQRGCLPSPEPHPQRTVTWAELAGVLRRWENEGAKGNGVLE